MAKTGEEWQTWDEGYAGLKKMRDDFLEENETDFTYRWSGAPTRKKK